MSKIDDFRLTSAPGTTGREWLRDKPKAYVGERVKRESKRLN